MSQVIKFNQTGLDYINKYSIITINEITPENIIEHQTVQQQAVSPQVESNNYQKEIYFPFKTSNRKTKR